MIREKKHFLKTVHANIGGGGFHCKCCAPSTRLSRKQVMHRMRQAYNRQLSKEVQQDLE